MTQETLGYVELEWTCKRCGTKNPGSTRTCSSCGAAMGAQDQFELPAQQVLTTENEQIGPDVHCPYCGTRNPAGSKMCSQCGGDLTEAAARETGRVLGAFQAAPALETPCPYCGTPNPADARRCKKCGGDLKRPAAAPLPQAQARKGISAGVIAGVAALLAVLCIGAIALFVLSIRTTDAPGIVQAVAWQRTIEIMEQRPVTHQDWQDQIPSGAQRGACESRLRRTQSNPAPGANKVCGTPYVIDQGSGKGKVVQDCQYEVYDNWCEYTRDEWTVVDKAVTQGNDLSARWPDTNLKTGQREGERGEKYQVTFAANDKRYTYQARDAAEFSKFVLGSRWTLKINTFGAVTSVQPAQ